MAFSQGVFEIRGLRHTNFSRSSTHRLCVSRPPRFHARMKLRFTLSAALGALALAVCLHASADEPTKPILVKAGKVVAEPDLAKPLDKEWSVRKGTWETKDGELVAAEIPEEKHPAVIWHQVGLQSAVVECDFFFDGAAGFLIGCDSKNHHVGRLVINRKGAKINEDSTEVKSPEPGKSHPGQTLDSTPLDLKPGQWYHLRFEWTGDQMAAYVDGHEIKGQHPTFTIAKVHTWFAVSGKFAKVRHIKISEGAP